MIAAAIASVVWAQIGDGIFAQYVPNPDPPSSASKRVSVEFFNVERSPALRVICNLF